MITALLKKLRADQKRLSSIPGEKKKFAPPVVLEIQGISREGVIGITFNQPMNVPDFIEQDTPLDSRRLVALSELDVARDIMNFDFVLRSDAEVEDLVFFLEI